MENSNSQKYVQGIVEKKTSAESKLEELIKLLSLKGIISAEQGKYFSKQLDLVIAE